MFGKMAALFQSSLIFRLRRMMSQIWAKVTAYSLLSVVTALAAIWLGPFIPSDLAFRIGADAAETILNIVATSMLTVATFSLGIMANAIAGAADSATPRATPILLEDRTSQNVLATFLGAFLFSLVGIIGLKVGVYEDGGRVILFAMTLLVILLIFVAFIRWINALRTFGRIPDTLGRIEQAVDDALERRLAHPYLDCHPLKELPDTAQLLPICAARSGFVQHIDIHELQALAEAHDMRIWINRAPGRYACSVRPLAYLQISEMTEDLAGKLRRCFTLGPMRTFAQDPQFGMIVFAETASRALSPAVNDPGTAIDVLRRAMGILLRWQERADPALLHDRIYMPGLGPGDFLQDLIRPIARDGAGIVEVQHVLLAVLRDLALGQPDVFTAPARVQAREALARAEAALTLDSEKAELRAIVSDLLDEA